MPCTPTRSTLTFESACACEVPAVEPAGRPKSREARSAPSAMVSTSMPSANPTSAMPIEGPCSVSGPRVRAPPAVVSPGADASRVNDWVRPATFLPGTPPVGPLVVHAGFVAVPRKLTRMLPVLNRSTVFLLSLSFRK